MSIPSLDEFVSPFDMAFAKAEWEVYHGRPQRARETARAWMGVIRLSTNPPKCGVAPVAPEIRAHAAGFYAMFLPAGTIFHYPYAHHEIVAWQLGISGARDRFIGDQSTFYDPREICLTDDRVLVTWDELGPHDPSYPPPAHFRLLRLGDSQQHEVMRLNPGLMRIFAEESDAQAWIKTRTAAA